MTARPTDEQQLLEVLTTATRMNAMLVELIDHLSTVLERQDQDIVSLREGLAALSNRLEGVTRLAAHPPLTRRPPPRPAWLAGGLVPVQRGQRWGIAYADGSGDAYGAAFSSEAEALAVIARKVALETGALRLAPEATT